MEVKGIDAAAFININEPKTSKTFRQYCSEEILWKVKQHLRGFKAIGFCI